MPQVKIENLTYGGGIIKSDKALKEENDEDDFEEEDLSDRDVNSNSNDDNNLMIPF